MMKTLLVRDQFVSYQGTGLNAGIRQDFVRLAGCKVRCPLRANCDQPEALSYIGTYVSLDDIVDSMQTNWLHITGGEPGEHENMIELCECAMSVGKHVQVQTSGTIPIRWKTRPFVSVSPKSATIENVSSCEIVLVAAKWMTCNMALSAIRGLDCPVFVIPEAINGQFDCRGMFSLLDELRASGVEARAGLQSHLVWGVA